MSSDSVAVDDDAVRRSSSAINARRIDQSVISKFASQRSDAEGLQQAILQLLLVGGFSYVWVYGEFLILRVAALLAQALVMAFFFNGLHECVHYSAFKTRFLNEFFANFYGVATTRPPKHYTYYHYNHHKFTGDPKRDPELQDSFVDMRLDRPLPYLCYLSGLPFWIDRSTTLLRHALFSWVLPREKMFLTALTESRMIAEARMYCLVYAIAAVLVWRDGGAVGTLGGFVLWHWWVPTLCAQPFLRFYLIAEHTGCPQGDDMLSNTRTTKTYAWYRWLAWQMPYHAEHHAFPNVPFHKLAALHRELAQKSEAVGARRCDPNGDSGYLGVHQTMWRKWLAGAGSGR